MRTFILVALLAAAQSVAAADLDYSYLDVAYSRPATDFSGSGSGYRLDGDYGFNNGFFLEAALQRNSFDYGLAGIMVNGNSNVITAKLESAHLGGGYHLPLTPDTDFIAHLAYTRAMTRLYILGQIQPDQWDSGYSFGVGVRDRVTDALELDAFLDHDDTGFAQHGPTPCFGVPFCNSVINFVQDGSETVLSLAGRYRFTDAFGVGLEYRHSSLQGGREWLLSGRWSF